MKVFFMTFLALAACMAAEVKLGKPLAVKQTTPIDKVLADPDQYAGKLVQVKGTVRDVCREMGCWTELVDSATGKWIRIKVNDGEIVFPKDSVGKTIVAEGKLVKIEQTKEEAIAQAKHEAEANKRKFDPASITAGRAYYQIQGTGAVILE
jgi:hypothetical protein